MDIQIIKSPSKGVLKMLGRRINDAKFFDNFICDSIGLVQGKLTEMLVVADIAEKSADVIVEEIRGICPQHFTMTAIFGDTSAVKAAVDAVVQELNEGRQVL